MTHDYFSLHVYLENGCMGDYLPQEKEKTHGLLHQIHLNCPLRLVVKFTLKGGK